MIKKQAIIAFALSICVVLTCFINAGNAATQTTYTMQSSGVIVNDPTIDKTEFLLRAEWINAFTTPSEVQEYVKAHPWGTGIILTDLSSGILSIISYNGWNASQEWFGSQGSITYEQLKLVIDEFHKLGWKVVYSAGNTPTVNDRYIYSYLTEEHPELIAVSADGKLYSQTHIGAVMVNFFANYTSADHMRNISIGQRLCDLYRNRLAEMISDGSFQWDGWFGVDGWNGFTVQEMYWVWSTNQPFGRWIGTDKASQWYYGDDQSIQEWSNSNYANELPQEWNSLERDEKIELIKKDYNLQWWEYWLDRYAQMYGQINSIFNQRPSEFKVGTIIAQDLSSSWAAVNGNSPVGMENLTAFERYNSFSHYYIDMESTEDLSAAGRMAAYVAGLVKSKVPSTHCIVGLHIQCNWGEVTPEWVWKQMYMAQAQAYVWHDGIRYRAVDPDWLMVFIPGDTVGNNTWDDSEFNGQKMADWVKSMANILTDDISPLWLGPTEILPLYTGYSGALSFNYTFAQFTDALNLNNTANNFVSGMNTVFLDAVRDYGNAIGGNAYQGMLDLYHKDRLNVIFYTYGYNSVFSNTLFFGEGDEELMSAFHLKGGTKTIGESTDAITLDNNEVSDKDAKTILGSTFGYRYVNLPDVGNMKNDVGMIPLITYADGYLELGIAHDDTTGKFVYGKDWSAHDSGICPSAIVSREVINRAITWGSNCPVTSSNALIDIKVFELRNGDIAITVMNLQDTKSDIHFSLDLTNLNIDYQMSLRTIWTANNVSQDIVDLSNIELVLQGCADILILSPA